MNIYDVSKKAGVSIATVSRVLNGNNNVSEKTKARVLEVIDELGYTPNVFARGLGLNTMKTIGIMCTDCSDPYLANAVYYLEQDLKRHEYDSILCCTGNNIDNKKNYLELLLSKRVDGIILIGSKFLDADFSENNAFIIDAAKNIPIMLVNSYLEGNNIYSAQCDDEAAVYTVTDALIKSGRKNIVYLYTSMSQSGRNKLSGYEKALEMNRIPHRKEFVQMCNKDIQRAKEYLNTLHENGYKFDAVVTSDDSLAVGALKYANEHGFKVPEELSVVGYNDSILAQATEPELTSIDSKVQSLCITTVNTLMGVFNGSDVPTRTYITADIIKRNTTNF
ncbi:MAG: LacI family transcriptional regulator [Lachnospiraceae bacterium]|nr:LacI family transcriptional regulator [Lachnospiraceae bacterium]